MVKAVLSDAGVISIYVHFDASDICLFVKLFHP